jgi:hypothetical protein
MPLYAVITPKPSPAASNGAALVRVAADAVATSPIPAPPS